ncbi:MAG: YfhO family protein [bacterium]
MDKKKKPPKTGRRTEERPAKKSEKAKASLLDVKLSYWKEILIALLLIYLITLIIFPENIFDHYNFLFGGDNLAAAPVAKMGMDFLKEGEVPNWCPYILGGMPMVGSLLFANHFYPGFAIGDLLGFLFFGSQYAWLFIHFLLAGLGVFILLRELQVHWIFAVLCALFFAFNPTMIVYANVGHGSKLMTIAFLPWILYLTKRLFDAPNSGRAAILAIVFGLQLLALHVQIAYYGAMLMGLYAVYSLIAEGKAGLNKNVKAVLLLIGSVLLALCLSAPLYLQVQEYSQFSIRGGGATGGASWDYATAWSFHPLESVTYIFPSFFGYGGATYWGFMPFTDMPLYWGAAVLFFFPWALLLKRDKVTYLLLIIALVAWIVSFGKFLPILYWPLYEFLPYFNKFRVPSLIQVLVLLPAVILAGRGLQALWDKLSAGSNVEPKVQWAANLIGMALLGISALLLITLPALKSSWLSWISAARPQMSAEYAAQAFTMLQADVIRLFFFTALVYGSIVLILQKKLPKWILIVALLVVSFVEILHFDKKLLYPTPPQQLEAYLQADDVVGYLKQDPEPFRILPLSAQRNPDWYMPHRIESVHGYTGAKMRIFQEALDSLSYYNLDLLRILNVRYLVIDKDKPINHPAFEEVLVGENERIYRFNAALPRAFLVNQTVQVASTSETLRIFRSGGFDFARIAILETPLKQPLDSQAQGSVQWMERSPDRLILNVKSSGQQFLVLSEVYYPSGWRATLDGNEIPIHKCNYLLRGLEIPPGEHRLELTFEPKKAGLGGILKWAAILMVVLCLLPSVWSYVKQRSKKKGPKS